MTEQYSFSYMLNKKTYKCLKKALVPYKKRITFTFVFVLSIFLNGKAVAGALSTGIYWDFIAFVPLTIFCIVWYAFYRKYAYGGYRKYTKKHLNNIPSVSVSFGDNIRVSSGDKNAEYSYSQISNIYEGEDAFYIKASNDLLFLPKAALSGGDLMDFRLFIMPKQQYETFKPSVNRIAVLALVCFFLSIMCATLLPDGIFREHAVTSPNVIVSEYYGEEFSLLYQYEIHNGAITFLYDSRNEAVTYCITVQKRYYNDVEKGGEYNLKEVADYNEKTGQLFWSKPISYSGNSLRYGWIYADSTLKNQIRDENIQSAVFIAGDKTYILYFTDKTGEK